MDADIEINGKFFSIANGGVTLGTVEEIYELPQGLALDVRRAEPRAAETVMLLYDDHTIASVDKERRIILVTPPEGLVE